MPQGLDDQLDQARDTVDEIDVDEAIRRCEAGAILLDIREQDEFDAGHIENCMHIARGLMELQIEQLCPQHDQELVLCCSGGVRSLLAGATLREMGYTGVASLAGGVTAWRAAGHPLVATDLGIAGARGQRYSRHIKIPEVGAAGQRKLLASRVLVVGAGGLGSPVAMYLAAAGVGTIGLADDDVVDLSNLQRQILHRTRNVGMNKTQSAAEMLFDLNPDVTVNAHRVRVGAANALELVSAYDLVVDGSDNFETRYVVNDAAVLAGKPNIYGSIFRFDGQVTTFPADGEKPCYRCLFPSPPPPEMAPT